MSGFELNHQGTADSYVTRRLFRFQTSHYSKVFDIWFQISSETMCAEGLQLCRSRNLIAVILVCTAIKVKKKSGDRRNTASGNRNCLVGTKNLTDYGWAGLLGCQLRNCPQLCCWQSPSRHTEAGLPMTVMCRSSDPSGGITHLPFNAAQSRSVGNNWNQVPHERDERKSDGPQNPPEMWP